MRVIRVLAPNAGVRELEGTNTWIVGEAPTIVIDPGPNHARSLMITRTTRRARSRSPR